jgi:hypothetical protein
LVTLRAGHRLRVFENRVLGRILRPKKEEVAGGWEKLCNKELHNLYASVNIIIIKSRRVRWAGHVAQIEKIRNVYKILVRKPEGNRSLRRHRCRWENNIRMDLRDQW